VLWEATALPGLARGIIKRHHQKDVHGTLLDAAAMCCTFSRRVELSRTNVGIVNVKASPWGLDSAKVARATGKKRVDESPGLNGHRAEFPTSTTTAQSQREVYTRLTWNEQVSSACPLLGGAIAACGELSVSSAVEVKVWR
jgi:hypothetical protein